MWPAASGSGSITSYYDGRHHQTVIQKWTVLSPQYIVTAARKTSLTQRPLTHGPLGHSLDIGSPQYTTFNFTETEKENKMEEPKTHFGSTIHVQLEPLQLNREKVRRGERWTETGGEVHVDNIPFQGLHTYALLTRLHLLVCITSVSNYEPTDRLIH